MGKFKALLKDPAFRRGVKVIVPLVLIKFAPRMGLPIDEETADAISGSLGSLAAIILSMAEGSSCSE